ncbi:MAG TPA: GNAT family N-acetyltransferase [Candidatus Saccharimonadales bacterium]|nr:GNAT family N-acetyltransferase [Candidatus Saccharimonadales bacterium]
MKPKKLHTFRIKPGNDLKFELDDSSVTIRKAAAEDVDAIYEFGKAVDEFLVNKETVSFWPKELMVHAIQSDDVLMLVAEDEAIIGFLIVNYNSGLRKTLIENIYVQPDKRGQGIGDKLLRRMFELLLEMGCEYVATLVPPQAQGAIDLYERSGFSQGETFVWLDKILDDRYKRHAKTQRLKEQK